MIGRSRTDGPQDPARHHRPAALRHARLQRRHARPHAGGRRVWPPTASATSAPIPQSVVCMPSRSTILTGQHPTTHGVWMNGVPLPVDAPSVAAGAARRRLPHRAHRQGRTSSRTSTRSCASPRTRCRRTGTTPPGGTHRGFEHLEFATHGAVGPLHYARWLQAEHPEAVGVFYAVLDARPAGERGGRRRHRRAAGARATPIRPRVVPHRLGGRSHDRLARLARRGRRLVLLDELPRPAPPVGPAAVRGRPHRLARRAAARRLPGDRRPNASASSTPSPATGGSGTTARSSRTTRRPPKWVPATLTADQVREVNARNAVECELIDEALGRVLAAIGARGLGRRRRHRLHDRPRRAAGRLRSAVQGAVPRRRV